MDNDKNATLRNSGQFYDKILHITRLAPRFLNKSNQRSMLLTSIELLCKPTHVTCNVENKY